jgi:hypothetical protein
MSGIGNPETVASPSSRRIRYNSSPMARSSQYSRSRRTLMQVIMWLVLAAMVGAAAFVTRQRLQARMVLPGEKAVQLLAVEVRLPRGWAHGTVERIEDPPPGRPPVAMTSATEFGRRGKSRDESRVGGRQLIIREEVVRVGITALQYIAQQTDEDVADLPTEQLADMGGQPGWLVEVPSQRGPAGARMPWGIYAATIFAPNRAVLIQLIGPGSAVPEDREDVRRLASQVRYVGDLPVLPGPRRRPATSPGE